MYQLRIGFHTRWYVFTTGSHPVSQVRAQLTVKDIQEIRVRFCSALDSYVGLDEMKDMLKKVISVAADSARYPDEGSTRPPNMMFLGPPGTGKTDMARLTGRVMHELGLLGSGNFVEATKQTLIGQYSNQVGDSVSKCVDRARGGVLFIDEVYALASGEKGMGQEAVNALVPLISDTDDVLFIIAGYFDATMAFMETNGTHSPPPHVALSPSLPL